MSSLEGLLLLVPFGKTTGVWSAPQGGGYLDGEESHTVLPIQNPQGDSPVGQRTVPTYPGFWNGCAGI